MIKADDIKNRYSTGSSTVEELVARHKNWQVMRTIGHDKLQFNVNSSNLGCLEDLLVKIGVDFTKSFANLDNVTSTTRVFLDDKRWNELDLPACRDMGNISFTGDFTISVEGKPMLEKIARAGINFNGSSSYTDNTNHQK